jgi:hypothetical protein
MSWSTVRRGRAQLRCPTHHAAPLTQAGHIALAPVATPSAGGAVPSNLGRLTAACLAEPSGRPPVAEPAATEAVEPSDESTQWLRDCKALYGGDSRFVPWPRHNARIHYVAKGTTGHRLLLVHGFGVGGYHFERNIDELSRDHQVWAVDLLGQGASWPLGPVTKDAGLQYSLDMWIEQLAFFIQEAIQVTGEGDCGVYIAGNSLGGLLAVSVAYRYPQVRFAVRAAGFGAPASCG